MALLNEINVKGVPHPIVTDDGYYEEMTVGDAEQLISTQFVEDNKPYLFRSTGGSSDVGNRAYIDKIVGGMVAWNQLAKPFTTADWSSDGQHTVVDGVFICTASALYAGTTARKPVKIYATHKYYAKANIMADTNDIVLTLSYVYKNCLNSFNTEGEFKEISSIFSPPNDGDARWKWQDNRSSGWSEFKIKDFEVIDLTQMFGSTIADYIYSIEQSQAGAGVAWFKKLFPKDYYAYNAGELLSVEGLQSHDTVGFNQWDEEWEVGSIYQGVPSVADNCIRSKNFCPCIGGSTYYVTCGKTDGGSSNPFYVGIYWYDADKNYISRTYSNNLTSVAPSNARYFKIGTNSSTVVYGNTYNHDICINLSNPSRNGEYEPYEKHSYPLDSSLTLRGIPKLDASNNLYYDGDEYTSDGKVKRKYGVVDLGTFNWNMYTYGEATTFRSHDYTGKKPSGSTHKANIMCAEYETVSADCIYESKKDKSIAVHNGGVGLLVNDSTYTDAAAFKEAMNGVMLYYELAAPTTETAEPFQHIQIVDDYGTEEFVSTGIVPVGHKTRYPANLRDKLQHLPDLASMDGTYLIKQTGKQMHLELFKIPKAPTTDGTYVLKATVSGGTPTYVWADVNAKSGGE